MLLLWMGQVAAPATAPRADLWVVGSGPCEVEQALGGALGVLLPHLVVPTEGRPGGEDLVVSLVHTSGVWILEIRRASGEVRLTRSLPGEDRCADLLDTAAGVTIATIAGFSRFQNGVRGCPSARHPCPTGSSCTQQARCEEDPPAVENCTDQLDNDGDGDVDCADSECANATVCNTGCNGSPTCVEVCDDQIDNDGDGAIDCRDTDCMNTTICSVSCCYDGGTQQCVQSCSPNATNCTCSPQWCRANGGTC